jgi:hypothetical protein
MWYLRRLSNGCQRITKKKDRNPNDPDISISTQHRQNKIFMHTISRKYPTNIPIFSGEKKCAKNAKISGEIH